MPTVRHAAVAVTLAAAIGAAPAAADLTVAIAQTRLRFWASADDFARHMSARVEEAMQRDPDLIAFPEDIGMPLVGLGDADLIAGAEDMEGAVAAMLTRHAEAVGRLVAQHEVSPVRAMWLAKAARIRAVYEETFSALSSEHDVWIAAGSVPLVPEDRPDQVLNTACVFDPEGGMHIAGTKVHLVPLEREDGLDLSPGSVEDYAVLRLPGATVGVIVCADAWDPAIAQHLVDQGAEVLMQVSANPEQWAADTRATWREGLFARVQELGVFGVSVMGVGNLLGLPVQGRSAALAPRNWTEDGSGYLAEADSATAERIVTASFDLSLIRPD